MNSLQDKGWNSMKHMLDEHMPVEKPRRPVFWWYLAPALLLLLVVAGGIYLFEPNNFGIPGQTQQALNIENSKDFSEKGEALENRITENQDMKVASNETANENDHEARIASAIHTPQPAGQTSLKSKTPNALQPNAQKNAIQKEKKQLNQQSHISENALETNEKDVEVISEPIALRPSETDHFDTKAFATEPLDLKYLEAAPTTGMADLAAPEAIQLVPLVQNIFQLRGHTGLYIPPGTGISGGAVGLSGRLEFKSKWGLHGGVDLGYLKPFREADINRNIVFTSSVENTDVGQPLSVQNYEEIKNYWLLNYYVQASYHPIKPVSLQLGFFHTRQLNGEDFDLITQDDTQGGPGIFTDLAYEYRESYTGLQAGMYIHLSPRISFDAQYQLATRSWFDSVKTRPVNLERGTHMHLFKLGASYRIL